jgi:hypothetical protein
MLLDSNCQLLQDSHSLIQDFISTSFTAGISSALTCLFVFAVAYTEFLEGPARPASALFIPL